MKTSSAKAKGRNLQKYVVQKLYEYFPALRDGDAESTSMGAGGVDVKLSAYARDLIPFSIECKAQEKVSIWAAWKQASENTSFGSPLLVIKRNHQEPLAILDFETFLELICQQLQKNKADNILENTE